MVAFATIATTNFEACSEKKIHETQENCWHQKEFLCVILVSHQKIFICTTKIVCQKDDHQPPTLPERRMRRPLVFSAPGGRCILIIPPTTGGINIVRKMLARPARRRTPSKLSKV